MSKVLIMQPCKLMSENEFTKVFKYKQIDLYLSKAFDDVENKHFLIASMPSIPECNVAHIQFPIPFESEELRNKKFELFDTSVAIEFIESIIRQIKFNKENVEKNSENNPVQDNGVPRMDM